MAYKASPRPTFTGPAPIPYQSVTRHLWGDDEAGRVDDWIYVSSMDLHQLVFGLPPGTGFTHSESFRTVFAADEVLTVLRGTMMIANPETGETHLVQRGESAFFQRDTWHHAWAWGEEELRVLEYFAPPPSRGTSGAYAKTRPYVSAPRYERPELIGRWPAAMVASRAADTIKILRDADHLHFRDTYDPRVLTSIIASTDELTSAKVTLQASGRSTSRAHGGAAGLLVIEGRVNVLIEDEAAEPPVWFELHPDDGFYIPPGCSYRLFNMGDRPAITMMGVAPKWAAKT
jgi:mannose-6-phosphate isomerase-like protein (cupin superfamily)